MGQAVARLDTRATSVGSSEEGHECKQLFVKPGDRML